MPSKFYYIDGTTSRESIINKVLHRLDGPAVEWADGTKFYFVNDSYLGQDDILWKEHPLVVDYNLNKLIEEKLNEVGEQNACS